VIKAGFPDMTILAETPLFWAMALDDVPYAAVMLAVAEYGKHGKPFPPKPTELRQIAAEQLVGLPSPEDAWLMVEQRIRDTYFPDRAPEWDAPKAVQDAVRSMGGVRALAMSSRPGDDQARFAKVYGAYRGRALREADLSTLWAEREAQLTAETDTLRALPAKERTA
ncbi:MAG: hypothetical protein K0S99_153, partial [Thermomicrobiales bacterium]|nr:hypothetical protein [Thermomicrobiales bacterium]